MENQIKENQEVEIDLGEIFHVLLGRIGIIILSGIVLGLVSIVGTMLFIDPQYESTTKIVVLSKQDNNTLTNQDMQTSTLLTKDYAELIKSRTVTEGVIAELNLDLEHKELLEKISVENQTDTRIVAISVRDEDPYMASQIANAIRDVASVHIQEVMDVDAVNVVETANIPNEPASPSLVKNGILGGVLGVVLSVIIILAVYLSNDTVKTPEDVERYLQLSVLGNIPLMDKEKKIQEAEERKVKETSQMICGKSV